MKTRLALRAGMGKNRAEPFVLEIDPQKTPALVAAPAI
jgi:hypothetical protein